MRLKAEGRSAFVLDFFQSKFSISSASNQLLRALNTVLEPLRVPCTYFKLINVFLNHSISVSYIIITWRRNVL